MVALSRATRFVGRINDSTGPRSTVFARKIGRRGRHRFFRPPSTRAIALVEKRTRRDRGSAIVLCKRGARVIFRRRMIDHSMSLRDRRSERKKITYNTYNDDGGIRSVYQCFAKWDIFSEKKYNTPSKCH